jgi:hypothetical protein
MRQNCLPSLLLLLYSDDEEEEDEASKAETKNVKIKNNFNIFASFSGFLFARNKV